MPLRFYLNRLSRYYNQYGLQVTLKRIKEKLIQSLSQRDEVVYYFDLMLLDRPKLDKPNNYKIEAKSKIDEIERKDIEVLSTHIGAEVLLYQLSERFAIPSIMWIIKIDDDLVGYAWSANKSAMNPPYLPICKKDVYIFDVSVLQQYRGKNIFPILLANMLFELKKNGFIRAFIVAHEWNKSVQRSFIKTQAQILGVVRTYSICGRDFIIWKK